VKELLRALRKKVEAYHQIADSDEVSDQPSVPVITLSKTDNEKAWKVEKVPDEDGGVVYRVRGHKIEKFARRTNFDGYENVNRLRDIMKKMGITYELKRQGADGASIIRIGGSDFTLVEQ